MSVYNSISGPLFSHIWKHPVRQRTVYIQLLNGNFKSRPISGSVTVLDKKSGISQDDSTEADSAMRRRLEDLEEQSQLLEPRKHIQNLETQELDSASDSAKTEADTALEELKARLTQKIQSAEFSSKNAGAIAFSQLSDSTSSKEIRDTAISRPWTGAESLEDAVLRSLHEAKPRLRVKPVAQTTRSSKHSSLPTNLAPRRRLTNNERIIAARDRAGSYPLMKKPESELNDEEREARSRMFRERFEPAGRAMPNTIQGLTALANEKIDEAIAKGLFKNLPSGPIQRDHHAESPFIDTTEYILNRMIQRQEIVPPWIEKQQELQKEVKAFRNRMRADWKRHVVRTIASWGGGPDVWVQRAKEYAAAERVVNPDPLNAYEKLSRAPKDQNWSMDGLTVTVGEQIPQSDRNKIEEKHEMPSQLHDTSTSPAGKPYQANSAQEESPMIPFRDSNWEKNEFSYHTVSIENLNNMTRSYNLQAPRLAQRPFINLRREILACYREVMPSIPEEMIERANNPNYGKAQLKLGEVPGSANDQKSFLGLLKSNEKGKVYDESEAKSYGLKEFWRDLFARPQ